MLTSYRVEPVFGLAAFSAPLIFSPEFATAAAVAKVFGAADEKPNAKPLTNKAISGEINAKYEAEFYYQAGLNHLAHYDGTPHSVNDRKHSNKNIRAAKQALRSFNEAIKLYRHPDYLRARADAYRNLGGVYNTKSIVALQKSSPQFSEESIKYCTHAIHQYEAALDDYPEHPKAAGDLAVVLNNRGYGFFLKALKQENNNEKIKYHNQALEDLTRALAFFENKPEYVRESNGVKQKIKDVCNAIAVIDLNFLKYNPYLSPEEQIRRYTNIIDALTRSVQLNLPNNPHRDQLANSHIRRLDIYIPLAQNNSARTKKQTTGNLLKKIEITTHIVEDFKKAFELSPQLKKEDHKKNYLANLMNRGVYYQLLADKEREPRKKSRYYQYALEDFDEVFPQFDLEAQNTYRYKYDEIKESVKKHKIKKKPKPKIEPVKPSAAAANQLKKSSAPEEVKQAKNDDMKEQEQISQQEEITLLAKNKTQNEKSFLVDLSEIGGMWIAIIAFIAFSIIVLIVRSVKSKPKMQIVVVSDDEILKNIKKDKDLVVAVNKVEAKSEAKDGLKKEDDKKGKKKAKKAATAAEKTKPSAGLAMDEKAKPPIVPVPLKALVDPIPVPYIPENNFWDGGDEKAEKSRRRRKPKAAAGSVAAVAEVLDPVADGKMLAVDNSKSLVLTSASPAVDNKLPAPISSVTVPKVVHVAAPLIPSAAGRHSLFHHEAKVDPHPSSLWVVDRHAADPAFNVALSVLGIGIDPHQQMVLALAPAQPVDAKKCVIVASAREGLAKGEEVVIEREGDQTEGANNSLEVSPPENVEEEGAPPPGGLPFVYTKLRP